MSSGCYEIFKKKNERKMKKRMKVSILSKGWKLKFLVSCSQFVFFFITISEPTSERKDKRCTTERTRNWQNRLKRTINHRTSKQPNKPQQLKQKKTNEGSKLAEEWSKKQGNTRLPSRGFSNEEVHFLMQPSKQHLRSPLQSQSVAHSGGRRIRGHGLGSELGHRPGLAGA